VHRHSQPISGLLAAHLVDAVSHLTDTVQVPHRRQGAEKQAEGERQLLIQRPVFPLSRFEVAQADVRTAQSFDHSILDYSQRRTLECCNVLGSL
jgi:hypothetical protein